MLLGNVFIQLYCFAYTSFIHKYSVYHSICSCKHIPLQPREIYTKEKILLFHNHSLHSWKLITIHYASFIHSHVLVDRFCLESLHRQTWDGSEDPIRYRCIVFDNAILLAKDLILISLSNYQRIERYSIPFLFNSLGIWYDTHIIYTYVYIEDVYIC